MNGRGRAGPGLETDGVAARAGPDNFVEAPEGIKGRVRRGQGLRREHCLPSTDSGSTSGSDIGEGLVHIRSGSEGKHPPSVLADEVVGAAVDGELLAGGLDEAERGLMINDRIHGRGFKGTDPVTAE